MKNLNHTNYTLSRWTNEHGVKWYQLINVRCLFDNEYLPNLGGIIAI